MTGEERRACPNCGTSLPGDARFCLNCGQDQRSGLVPFGEVLLDVLRDTFAFDSKFFNSVPKLLFKPGALTVDFRQERRARHIPAVRMYVFVSVVAFLIFSLGEERTPTISDRDKGVVQVQGLDQEMAAIDSLGVDAWQRERAQGGGWGKRLENKVLLLNHEGRFDEVFDRFQRQLPLMLLVIIPLVALLLKLFFWRSLYVVHLVFAFHLAAFALIVAALLHLAEYLTNGSFSFLTMLFVFAYMVPALHRVHGLRWIWSTVLALLLTLVLTVLVFLGLAATMVFAIDSV
ncbi:MAG: DUF3667 domain-containing protein [Flavobacteriales bacterium]|nr:DUF3667 domain-containing protein [Flavobacteriales bacterium]MCB9166566.1 DUF3667 domain-containing protein [Flavobacteriales bacterium]MCB9194552.1 DUF3667 domain-containing protein [Flavobacteriales bacterium]